MFCIGDNNEIALTKGADGYFKVGLVDESGKPRIVRKNESLLLTVKRTVNDKTPALTKVVVGTNIFHIEPKDTERFGIFRYRYTVELILADGSKRTVIPFTTFNVLREGGLQ